MKNKKLKGFIEDLSNEDYHADRTHKSSSVLKTALNDPKKYYEKYVKGLEEATKNQDALNFGNYVHTSILEPHLLDKDYIVYPGGRRQGQSWELFKHLHRDKIILTNNQYMAARDLIDSFLQTEFEQEDSDHLVFGDALFKGGKAEESLFTKLEGMNIKVRFDYRITGDKKGVIKDIKTTRHFANSPRDARDVVESLGYDLSAALYVDAVEKETGIPHDFHLVFMSKADLKCNLYKVSDKTLARGREKYKEAIKKIKEWEKTGDYVLSKIREV